MSIDQKAAQERISDMFFSGETPTSEYPANFIPADAGAFIATDTEKDGGETTVKGFRLDGDIHIQEVTHNTITGATVPGSRKP